MRQVHGPHGDYIVRAMPWNYRLDSFGVFAPLERRLRRDHRWHRAIRRFHDDPLGPPLREEYVQRQEAEHDAVAELEDLVASGSPPFDGSD